MKWSWLAVPIVGPALVLSNGIAPVLAEPSPEALSTGVVAVVSHVPAGVGTITLRELRRTMTQTGARRTPKPGQPKYKQAEDEAFGELLDMADLEGEAAARNLTISAREVSLELLAIKEENFQTEAAYRHFLHQYKLSEKEVRERVRLQLISTQIEEAVTRGARGAHNQIKALSDFVDAYRKRWRARTVCAPDYAIERCSNGPEPKG